MKLAFLRTSLAAMSLPLLLCSTTTFAADGKPLSKEWTEGRIQGALSYNTYLDSTDLEVSLNDGIATLSGAVPSEVERDLAEAITRNVQGVRTVENQIKIDPLLAPRGRADALQKIVDATTTASVKSRLLTSKRLQNMNIMVSTKDSVVSLSGYVSELAQKETAETIAYNTRDVRDVRNDLKITDAKTIAERANNASVSVTREISDTWISSKIRSSLMFSSDFPGSEVHVSTAKGEVTLDGYAKNSTQRAAIESSVNDFVGVKSVQNNLTLKANG